MCGIYGAIAQQATTKVWQGLKRIEYRGYDSWGIAILQDGTFQVQKQVGAISATSGTSLPEAALALGHTRWATHGGVTVANAHPHQAKDGSFVLVQNGVVENYQTLRQELQQEGYQFSSETDTEVIVGLLEQAKRQAKVSELNEKIITQVLSRLAGRSTVVIGERSGVVYGYRAGSPLIIGRNQANGEVFLSSDVVSLAPDATEYVVLDHQQLVRVAEQSVQGFQQDQPLELEWQPLELHFSGPQRAEFGHVMMAEIQEQPRVWHQVIQGSETAWAEVVRAVQQARTVYTLGAGSASYAAKYLAFRLRQQGVAAIDVPAYEARSWQDFVGDQDVAIAISQSGETADTLEVVEWWQSQGTKVIGLVNMPGSSLLQQADIACLLSVGPEIGVASTKALTGQMIWGEALAQQLSGQPLSTILQAVETYEKKVADWLQNTQVTQTLQQLTSVLESKEHAFVLGRGELYPAALEFALKLKEIAYLHTEGFSGGELKHGVIALVEEGTPVFCLIGQDKETADMLNAAAEVKARGALVIGVAAENNELFDFWLPLADSNFAAVSSILPAQVLTYHLAVAQGLDPDKPRNLAKSVTVK